MTGRLLEYEFWKNHTAYKEELEKYIAHMRELARQNDGTFLLDFSDVVVSLQMAES